MSSPDTNSTALANVAGHDAHAPNATAASTSSTSQAMSVFAHWDFLLLTTQITVSAMTIIWLGANSSLRRPPSAAPADKGKGKKRAKEDNFSEGFAASDAIMFPLLAGTVLVGLYYLIKWLQDPDILNKILRGYMSIMSVASLGKLTADALHLLTTLVFPSVWSDRTEKTYEIDTLRRKQILLGPGGTDDTVVNDKRTPFPGRLSGASFSENTNRALWEIRHLLVEEWTVRTALHGVGSGHVHIKLNDLLGFVIALMATMAYYMTGWVWLSNILGSAFCYAAFTLMSPTSFRIGTMVLAGLFVYDIVMVFYTPYMVTVATKLDVPIKLVFQGPSRSSILGLGDIVVPGIFIGLALRFDLWRHYNSKITSVPTELKSEFTSETQEKAITTTQTQNRCVKATYVDPRGHWGDRMWTTTSLWSVFSAPTATPTLAATAFPKPYFYSSMAGYAVGMLLTLVMLLVFNHGQPALLYLVPCVTGAVWLVGAVRGELRDLLTYTEDGSLDTKEVVVEVDGSGKAINDASEEVTNRGRTEENSADGGPGVAEGLGVTEPKAETKKPGGPESLETSKPDGGYNVFLFSVTAPGPGSLTDD